MLHFYPLCGKLCVTTLEALAKSDAIGCKHTGLVEFASFATDKKESSFVKNLESTESLLHLMAGASVQLCLVWSIAQGSGKDKQADNAKDANPAASRDEKR
jgi:hypothetical protein